MGIFDEHVKWRVRTQPGVPPLQSCYYQIIADLTAIRYPLVGSGVRPVTHKMGWALARYEEAEVNPPNPRTQGEEYCVGMTLRIARLKWDENFRFTPEEHGYLLVEKEIYHALVAYYMGHVATAEACMERARRALHALIAYGTTLFPTRVSAVRFDGSRWVRTASCG